jgi:hypothetical protein
MIFKQLLTKLNRFVNALYQISRLLAYSQDTLEVCVLCYLSNLKFPALWVHYSRKKGKNPRRNVPLEFVCFSLLTIDTSLQM